MSQIISISSVDLPNYLESTFAFKIVGLVDLDWLKSQPRKTLFELLKNWRKEVFDANERIVLFSREQISRELLYHLQKCVWQIDISNWFILLCAPNIDHEELELARSLHSSDDQIFSHLDINFTDELNQSDANILLTLPESFCFSPWTHLEISSIGEFRPCCVYKESIKKPNGQPYNINQDMIENVYKSQYLIDLRNQFANGERPAECMSCWHKEQAHGESNRTWFTDHIASHFDLLEIENFESIDNLISLDIKMGNLCNFKCRICNPISSSRIAEEMIKHRQKSFDLKALNANGKWSDDHKIWQSFELLAPNLVNIDFYGGEPFLIKQHEFFIDFLIQRGFSKKIRLHYNTNGSIYPEKLIEKWKQFREIDIGFSIDNIGDRFELERGGSWKQINDNLDRFINCQSPNMILSIFSTVNAQNVYYLGELMDWFETKKFNRLVFNLLETPESISITNMNSELTELVIDKLNQIDKTRLTRYNIIPIIEILEKNIGSNDLNVELANFMKELDIIRHEDLSKTHPEIAQIIYRGK
jgi:sulfatase maturation enzyme AslB (radical SAM superfamily)